MNRRSPIQESRWVLLVSALCAAGALLILPGLSLAGPPAADEYNLDFPDAKGKQEPVDAAPAPQLNQLPPAVASQLSTDPEGRALAAISTARELGAPKQPTGSAKANEAIGSNASSSVTSAAASSFGNSGVLALLGALAILAAVLFAVRLRGGAPRR